MTELAVTLKATVVNPDVGDLMLDETSGDVVLHTSLQLEVAQRIMVALNFFRSEWFLGLDEGTPYYQEIFKKGVSDRTIRAVFGAVIRSAEGVAELVKLTYEVSATRQLTLRFEARLEDSTVLRSTDFAPFVVQP